MNEMYASRTEYQDRLRDLLGNTDAIAAIFTTLTREERISLDQRLRNGAGDVIASLTGTEREVAETMDLLRPLGEIYNRLIHLDDNAELASLSFSSERIERYVLLAGDAYTTARQERGFLTICQQYVFAFINVLTHPDQWSNFAENFSLSVQTQEAKRIAISIREDFIDRGESSSIADLVSGINGEDRFVGPSLFMDDPEALQERQPQATPAPGWNTRDKLVVAAGAATVGYGGYKLTGPIRNTAGKVSATYSLRAARAEQTTLRGASAADDIVGSGRRITTAAETARLVDASAARTVRLDELGDEIRRLEEIVHGKGFISRFGARGIVGATDAARGASRIGSRTIRGIPIAGWVVGAVASGGIATWIYSETMSNLEEMRTDGMLDRFTPTMQEDLRGYIEIYAALEAEPTIIGGILGQRAIYNEVASIYGTEVAATLFPGTWAVSEQMSFEQSNYRSHKITNGDIMRAFESGNTEHPILLLIDERYGRTNRNSVRERLESQRNALNGSDGYYSHKEGYTIGARTAASQRAEWDSQRYADDLNLLDGHKPFDVEMLTVRQLRRDISGRGVIYQQLTLAAGADVQAVRNDIGALMIAINDALEAGEIDANSTIIVNDFVTADRPLTQLLNALDESGYNRGGAITLPNQEAIGRFNESRDTFTYVSDLREISATTFGVMRRIEEGIILPPLAAGETVEERVNTVTNAEIRYLTLLMNRAQRSNAPQEVYTAARALMVSYNAYLGENGIDTTRTHTTAMDGAGFTTFSDLSTDTWVDALSAVNRYMAETGINELDAFNYDDFYTWVQQDTGLLHRLATSGMTGEKLNDHMFMRHFITFALTDGRDELEALIQTDLSEMARVNEVLDYFFEHPDYLGQLFIILEERADAGDRTALELLEQRDALMGNGTFGGRRSIQLRGRMDSEDIDFLMEVMEYAERYQRANPRRIPNAQNVTAAAAVTAVATDETARLQRTAFSGSLISISPEDLRLIEYTDVPNAANGNYRPLGVVTGADEVSIGSVPSFNA